MSKKLRAAVRVKQDPSGQDMIYPWKQDKREDYWNGVEAFLEIDNRKCATDERTGCFNNADYVGFVWWKAFYRLRLERGIVIV